MNKTNWVETNPNHEWHTAKHQTSEILWSCRITITVRAPNGNKQTKILPSQLNDERVSSHWLSRKVSSLLSNYNTGVTSRWQQNSRTSLIMLEQLYPHNWLHPEHNQDKFHFPLMLMKKSRQDLIYGERKKGIKFWKQFLIKLGAEGLVKAVKDLF